MRHPLPPLHTESPRPQPHGRRDHCNAHSADLAAEVAIALHDPESICLRITDLNPGLPGSRVHSTPSTRRPRGDFQSGRRKGALGRGVPPLAQPRYVESSSLGNNDTKTRAGCEARAHGVQGKVCRRPQAPPPPARARGCQEEGGVHLGGKPPSQPAAMVTLSLQRCLQPGNCPGGQPLPSRCAHQCQRPPSSRQSQPGWAPASWRRAARGARGPFQPLGLLGRGLEFGLSLCGPLLSRALASSWKGLETPEPSLPAPFLRALQHSGWAGPPKRPGSL